MVAYHDLKGTPSSEEIANILKKEIDAGGDVAKIVVKPNSQADVLRFLNGTLNLEPRTLLIRLLPPPVVRKDVSLD